jgi:flagellum-specific peptidoglycan hydrolase FlgJ
MSSKSYIENFKDLAVKEMLRSGVPASITLAQGMLESDNGNSKLAKKANNHFGIKCHKDWTGPRISRLSALLMCMVWVQSRQELVFGK